MSFIKVGLCQINTVVGDLDGNVARILAMTQQADAAGCDIAVFPELTITGYPPEDLLLKPGFIADNLRCLEAVAEATKNCRVTIVVGYVDGPEPLFNAAGVCAKGKVVGTYHKRLLPNYAVFDEKRYFTPGEETLPLFNVAGTSVGVSICEDIWSADGPVRQMAGDGARLIVNLNSSPFYAGRVREREEMLMRRSLETECSLVYVNQVGGQDELVFDGASMVFDSKGTLIARSPQFVEHLQIVDVEVDGAASPVAEVATCPEPIEEIYQALVVGTRDYVIKNGFTDVVIGMSGGIDSSLVALIAVDALGAEHVHGVSMPSRFSSDGSKDDARDLATRLGISLQSIPIEPAHAALLTMLGLDSQDRRPGLTEENLQSRIRAVLLMGLSNEYGWMVLTTGNKSEMAVGYSTLYGDSAGGFAVIKDVPKTLVYELCRYRNRLGDAELISESVLSKPPSAELRPEQRDDQSLPAYELLDPLVEAYVERDMTRSELEKAGFDPVLVDRVTRLVDISEYKRRQTPPGVRVTPKAFGKDRRLPITNRYNG